MPSGAKKRKAAKKKLQKEAYKNGSHHQGFHDYVESDAGKVGRESCEDGTGSSHVEGAKDINLGGDNSNVEVKEGGNFKTVKPDYCVGVSHNGGVIEENRSSSSNNSEDDEVIVERKEQVVSVEILEATNEKTSVTSEVYCKSIEDSIPTEESVKLVVSLPDELSVDIHNTLVENSGFKQNKNKTLKLEDENDRFSQEVTGFSHEKTEERAIIDVNSVKSSEPRDIPKQEDDGLMPQSSGVTGLDLNLGDDYVKESEKPKAIEEQHVVSSLRLPVQQTSWMNCCGLFDILTRDSKAKFRRF